MHSATFHSSAARAVMLAIALQSLLFSATLARSWLSSKDEQQLQILEQLESANLPEKRQITTSGGFSFNTINTCLVVSLFLS